MKILLTGASGLLGINFALTASKEHDVMGVYHHQSISTHQFLPMSRDLFNIDGMNRFLELHKPDWIVHCAALADVDQCEKSPDTAYQMHVTLSKLLAESASQQHIKFLYISTDAVFD